MQDQIFNMLMKEDDITWQSILSDLVKSEKMDPWDIDVSLLTKRYIEMLQKLKELDFKVTGKVVLCAALLLKMKSTQLVGADLERFDLLFAEPEEDIDGFMDDDYDQYLRIRQAFEDSDELRLIPRTPQPRSRKVSIYDLMEALQKAMEVKKRRVMRHVPDNVEINIPTKRFDITEAIREVYGKLKMWFFRNNVRMKFKQLVPGDSKLDKVYTFIPLLHLTNERKVDLFQEEHFGEIEVELLKKSNVIDDVKDVKDSSDLEEAKSDS